MGRGRGEGQRTGRMRTGGGGKPPPYAVRTYQPVMWFSACTSGGTHRSRPTNYVGSPSGNVGRHLRVPPCGIWDGSPPHRGESIPTAGASPRPTRSDHISLLCGFRRIPAAGHIGPALRDHTEPGSGGAEGPLALSPQQCEAWIECAAALLENHRTKSLKNLKISTLKVLLDFFQKIVGSRGKAPVARRNGRNPLTDAPARGWPAGLRPACRRLRDAGTGDHRRGRVPDRCGPR